MRPIFFLLFFIFFIQGCMPHVKVYSPPELPRNELATVSVSNNNLSISSIDGMPTTSLGRYMIKGKFESEVLISPGKHEILLFHKQREGESKAAYALEVKQGQKYLVKAEVLDRSAILWIEEESTQQSVGKLIESRNEAIIDHTKRLDNFNLFSLLPPKEDGWIIVARDSYGASLAKQGKNADETHVITIFTAQIPSFDTEEEFRKYIIDKMDIGTDSKRFKKIKGEVIPYTKQDFCFQKHDLVEDHGAQKRSSRTDHMILEMYSLSCRHPVNRNLVLNIGYSHRYYTDYEKIDILSKAKDLFYNFEFK